MQAMLLMLQTSASLLNLRYKGFYLQIIVQKNAAFLILLLSNGKLLGTYSIPLLLNERQKVLIYLVALVSIAKYIHMYRAGNQYKESLLKLS